MAGRTQNPGGKPKQLGPPELGFMRRMTTNEAVASGFTRTTLILGGADNKIVIFKPTTSGTNVAYRIVEFEDNPEAYTELYRFWGEEMPRES